MMEKFTTRTIFAGLATMVLMFCTACDSGQSLASPVEETAITADWNQPLTVCEGIDEEKILDLLPPSAGGDSFETELDDGNDFDLVVENEVSSTNCTFSTGPKAARITVNLVEQSSSEAANELNTSIKNLTCEVVDDVSFLYCDKDNYNQYWLTSVKQLGTFTAAIKGFSFGVMPDDEHEFRTKMIALHHSIDQLLINSGKVDESEATSESTSSQQVLDPEDACVFSYEEVNQILSFDNFHTSSTTDQSEWITAFGEETLEAGCSYERDEAEYSQANMVTGMQVLYLPYRDDPDNFYLDRATGFDESCQMLKDSSDEVFGREVNCFPGEDADVVVAGLMATAFTDDFAWQINLYGTVDTDTVSALTTLINHIQDRQPGDQRSH